MTIATKRRVDITRGAARRDPVHLGHHEVGDQQVEPVGVDSGQCFLGRNKSVGDVALERQAVAEGAHEGTLVIDDEDARGFVIGRGILIDRQRFRRFDGRARQTMFLLQVRGCRVEGGLDLAAMQLEVREL
jgi:hypothetical protein